MTETACVFVAIETFMTILQRAVGNLIVQFAWVPISDFSAPTGAPSLFLRFTDTIAGWFRVPTHDIPMGLRVSQVCDYIYKQYRSGHSTDADELLGKWCESARAGGADSELQQSVFGLMMLEDIKVFLMSTENQLWHEIIEETENFLDMLDRRPPPPPQVETLVPPGADRRMATVRPCIMDQTVREPATTTPFGHTGKMKYLTLKIVQKMGFQDIAISGQYYRESYTPETQILEEMQANNEDMTGMILMFAPNDLDRRAGVNCIKRFKVPNAFLDLTFQASVRFADSNFMQSVLDAVQELDGIFNKMRDVPQDPWRPDDCVNRQGARGEISVNLVDIMEFLELEPNGRMNMTARRQLEQTFATWKSHEAFRRRVVAILFEEGRGLANCTDYGHVASFLRTQFPQTEKYRILVHAHAGQSNQQDAASVEALCSGANGVWAALIPQAAQKGHNSSMVFLDNMLQLGNEHVLRDFRLHQARECARHCYYLNFNTYNIPDDCPIWGGRGDQLVHTAFVRHVGGATWRAQNHPRLYDIWHDQQREKLLSRRDSDLHVQVLQERVVLDRTARGQYRIAPLVSDTETWIRRIDELKVVQDLPTSQERDRRLREFADGIRGLGFALMNANIRANLNERTTLQRLAGIVQRNREEASPCHRIERIENYLKSTYHQGQGE